MRDRRERVRKREGRRVSERECVRVIERVSSEWV